MNVSQNVELYSYLFSDQVLQGVRKKGGFIYGQFSDISDDGGHLVNIDKMSFLGEVVGVYDLKKARLKCLLATAEIKCVSIATTQRQVLTGSAKHCLSIWDLNTDSHCIISQTLITQYTALLYHVMDLES